MMRDHSRCNAKSPAAFKDKSIIWFGFFKDPFGCCVENRLYEDKREREIIVELLCGPSKGCQCLGVKLMETEMEISI